MELRLLETQGFSPDAILSIRAGNTRRQVQIDHRKPLQFPSLPIDCNPVRIDVLQPIGGCKLNIQKVDVEYEVGIPNTRGDASTASSMGLRFSVREESQLCGKSTAELKFATNEAQGFRAEHASYLSKYDISMHFTEVLKCVLRDKPDDPFEYIGNLFLGKSHGAKRKEVPKGPSEGLLDLPSELKDKTKTCLADGLKSGKLAQALCKPTPLSDAPLDKAPADRPLSSEMKHLLSPNVSKHTKLARALKAKMMFSKAQPKLQSVLALLDPPDMRAQYVEEQKKKRLSINIPFSDKEPGWTAATWNAAGEVKRLEFFPFMHNFPDAMERTVGSAALRLAGFSENCMADTSDKRWARYGTSMPSTDLLIAVTMTDLLKGLDVTKLAAHWNCWLAANPGGENDLRAHIDEWRQIPLDLVMKCAMSQGNQSVGLKIPGLNKYSPTILSNPDSWFSGRKYHPRGDLWLEFLKDAANLDFTEEQYWDKWIHTLSTTYKWQADRPIEFIPTMLDLDYMACAVLDRFYFLAARYTSQGGNAPTSDAEWDAMVKQTEQTPQDMLKGTQNVLEWAINTAKVDVLFLQEAGDLALPAGWISFPPSGSTTQIWVPESCMNAELTEQATAAMKDLKDNMLTAKEAWGRIEQSMIDAGCKAMGDSVAESLEELNLHEEAAAAIQKMAMTAVENGVKELSRLRCSPDMKLLKKIQRWFAEDKLATAVIYMGGEPYVLISAHGESMGSVSRVVLGMAHALHHELEQTLQCKLGVIVGMDANSKKENEGAKTSPDSLKAAATSLGFICTSPEKMRFAGSEDPATLTVLKTRTFMQPQFTGKAGIPDENKKDWIFMKPRMATPPELSGRVLNNVSADSPEGRYLPGGMPIGMEFPSDHTMVIAQCPPSGT